MSMDPLTYRDATIEDVPSIVSVIHRAFEEYRGRMEPPAGALGETEETLRQKMASAHVILALAGARIAGCVLYEFRDGYVYLGRLAVLPEFRRRGIARELVARIEAEAHAHGYRRVRVSVRIALIDNQDYFQRLGYRVLDCGTHAGYTEPTYVNMEKVRPDG